jgi:hypothetical protein
VLNKIAANYEDAVLSVKNSMEGILMDAVVTKLTPEEKT